MSLSIRQMELLRAVLRTRSVTGAAQMLNVSQPAASRMLKHIEASVGVPLFDRRGGRMEPTPQVLALENSIDDVFRNVYRTQRMLGDVQKGFGETLRIAALPTLANTFLPAAVARLSARAPKLRFVLKSLEQTPMESRIRSGDYAFGLTQAPPRRPDIAFSPVLSAAFACILRRDHPLARRRRIDAADLAGEQLISFSERVAHGRSLDEAFEDADAQRRVGIQTTSSALAIRLVEEGYGVALVDPFALHLLDREKLVARALSWRTEVQLGFLTVDGRKVGRHEALAMDEIRTSARDWSDSIRKVWGSTFLRPDP